MNKLLVGFSNKTDLLLELLEEEGTVTLVDTTGEVAPAFGDRLPAISNALYLDAADTNYPVGLNVFDGVLDHHTFTEQITDYIDHMFPEGKDTLTRGDSVFLLESCVLLLLEQRQPQTLLSVLKLLTDTNYTNDCLKQATDPVVKLNWAVIRGETDNSWDNKKWQAVFTSLYGKLSRLLKNPLIRNIVGQPYNLFGDEVTVIIANLDREEIGNKAARLLGGLLIARSQGQVVIPDYGFFNTPIPLEQNRFTLGVNTLDESEQNLLGIEEKYIFATHEKDADVLKRYVGVPESHIIMDLDPDEYRISHSDKTYDTKGTLPLGSLKALKNKTRGCHAAKRLQVERDIKIYLASQKELAPRAKTLRSE